MDLIQTVIGVNPDSRTPFERWVEDELHLEIVRGYAAGPLGSLPLRWWEARNLDIVFIDLIGAESLAGMYVAEIRPGASSTPLRQIYDETFYVLDGHGSTTIEMAGRTIQFEWGPRSLFAIPLNCSFQLHNGSGIAPARLVSTNTLPIVYSLYRDPAFIFGNPHDFDRLAPQIAANPTAATLYKPDAGRKKTAVDLYDTLFLPDVLALQRTDFRERGEGNSSVYIETAKSTISAHVGEIPGRRFMNPHRHGPAASVFTVGGTGYSLMWQDGGEMIRWDWPVDGVGVIVPPNMWWHGHFVTSPSALQLAVKLRSRFNPINHLYEKTHIPVSDGGTVLLFSDLNPALRARIWDTYVEECRRQGHEAVPPRAAAVSA